MVVRYVMSCISKKHRLIDHQIRIQPPTARIIGGKGKNFAISCLEDISIWRPIALAGHTVYSQEVLLTGALTQQLLWSDPQYHVNK